MIIPSIHKPVFLLFLCALLTSPISAISLSPGSSFTGAPALANGDPVYIHGIATGHPQGGLHIWLIGYNYVKITSVSTNADNTYEYELKPADTRTLAPGQYFILIQHPMMNAEFDIFYDSSTGGVFNRQLGAGTSIFQLTGAGSLQSPDGANALMQAINSQNIDDTFATASFIIGNPAALINPVGDHAVGDRFTITGSTNLAEGDDLLIEVYSSSFRPTSKVQSGEFSGSSGMIRVEPGIHGLNRWSFPVDASTFKPDEYVVKVSGITVEVTGSTTFNIIERLATTRQTPAPATTLQTIIPTPTTLLAPIPTTQKSPLVIFTIPAGLLCAFLILRMGREKI